MDSKIAEPAGSIPCTNQTQLPISGGCGQGRCHSGAPPSSILVPKPQESSPQCWHHLKAQPQHFQEQFCPLEEGVAEDVGYRSHKGSPYWGRCIQRPLDPPPTSCRTIHVLRYRTLLLTRMQELCDDEQEAQVSEPPGGLHSWEYDENSKKR